MRGLICYFSTTGNTKLACEAIAIRVKNIEWVLHDITKATIPTLKDFDIIGLATFTDFWGPPQRVQLFIEGLERQNNDKAAFVINTHGGESGKTLMVLLDWMKSKGFKVFAGHSLLMPCNYPPILADGWNNNDDPDEQSIKGFDAFISSLTAIQEKLIQGEEIDTISVHLNEKDMSFPYALRTSSKEHMGDILFDTTLCSNCGYCQKVCPYQAIELCSIPVADNSKCYGCWSCYNHCPTKAIHTKKLKGSGHYEIPIQILKRKLGL